MEGFFSDIKAQLLSEAGIGAGANSDWFFSYPKNKSVIEVGFGQGELIEKLVEIGNDVVGVDIGGESHILANKKGLDKKAKLYYLDISHDKIPISDNTVDIAYCTEVIEHLECPAHLFIELKRVLKPDGLFVLAFPRPEDNIGFDCGQHAHMYPGLLIKKSFRLFCDQMYFKILKYAENGSSAWYLLKSVKTGNEIGIHEIIRGNFTYEQLFGHLHDEEAWKPENDPAYIYKNHQAINLFEGIKHIDKD